MVDGWQLEVGVRDQFAACAPESNQLTHFSTNSAVLLLARASDDRNLRVRAGQAAPACAGRRSPILPRRQSPEKELTRALEGFGGLESFRTQFDKAALEQFGSGWAWLVKDSAGALKIVTSSNAKTPIREGRTPLLTCDVWEHACYIDHRNDRGAYLKNFWQLVNWEFLAANLER